MSQKESEDWQMIIKAETNANKNLFHVSTKM